MKDDSMKPVDVTVEHLPVEGDKRARFEGVLTSGKGSVRIDAPAFAGHFKLDMTRTLRYHPADGGPAKAFGFDAEFSFSDV